MSIASISLDQLRFAKRANVYKGNHLAGTLSRDSEGVVEFKYRDDYVGDPVAFSLPLGETSTQQGGALPAFFAGLLPEGHRLNVLNRATKTSMNDEFTMLLAVGADTPGDVRIFASEAAPNEVPPLYEDPSRWSFQDLTEMVDPYAVPGVQPKASASMINMPIRTRRTHAILKIDPAQYPHLVRNEALHLRHAHGLKIPVAKSQLVVDKEGVEGLLVERFDRRVDASGQIVRLAQEDASQVLQIPPSEKYNVESEAVVAALAQHTSAPMVAIRALYVQFLFAWLTGNGDVHAKNLSILRNPEGVWEVAPMYDLPCTALYRDFTMALPIDGQTKNLRGRHWDAFADNIGLPIRAARSAQRLVLRVAKGIDLSELPFDGSPLHGAQRELSSRRHQMESLLDT